MDIDLILFITFAFIAGEILYYCLLRRFSREAKKEWGSMKFASFLGSFLTFGFLYFLCKELGDSFLHICLITLVLIAIIALFIFANRQIAHYVGNKYGKKKQKKRIKKGKRK